MTTQIKSFPTKAKIRRALDVIIGAGFEPRAIEITETGAVRVETRVGEMLLKNGNELTMLVKLKGLHRVKKKLSSGKSVTYFYAWRGGPRLLGVPGTPEFLAEFQQAKADTKTPLPGTLRSSIFSYRKSSAFAKLGDKSKQETIRHLDLIAQRFADAPLAVFADARIRAKIIDWRENWANRPRTADLLVGTLARVLDREVDRGALAFNHASRVSKIYKPQNRAKIIWEADELEALCYAANPFAARAFRLAAATGLRRSDLVKITWDADKGSHLEWISAKRKREVMIPISQQCRKVLNEFPRTAITIVTNSKGQPYTAEGLGSAFQAARRRSKTTKRFHDLRGTAATHFAASLDDRTLAEIMGWSIETITAIRRRYVDRTKIISASIERLNRNQKAT